MKLLRPIKMRTEVPSPRKLFSLMHALGRTQLGAKHLWMNSGARVPYLHVFIAASLK